MGPVSIFWLQSLDVSTNYLEVAEKSATVKKPRKLNAICEICNKAFRDNWKLKRHMVVHIKAGEISYQEEEDKCSLLWKHGQKGTFCTTTFVFDTNSN